MAAILALCTFAFFIGLDFLLTRRAAARVTKATQPAFVPSPLMDLEPAVEPVFVAGYELPEQYHYHRGHTWARVLDRDTVAIGMDDFARRLIGKAKTVRLPKVGAWLRQGSAAFAVGNGDRSAAMLAPVEGQVIEVNPEAEQRASLCTDDPYRRGWLLKVRSASLAENLRNLMSGRLARRWMEDAREQFELRLMALSGSVLQDGGEPAPDFADHLTDEEWSSLVEAFLLAEAETA
ncbi:MAG: glycine cleavage system protein H [Planctomycetota bacterium]|jgi:glycine cleavage system H lipoate-binding protein